MNQYNGLIIIEFKGIHEINSGSECFNPISRRSSHISLNLNRSGPIDFVNVDSLKKRLRAQAHEHDDCKNENPVN